jgi:hypothetical protein
VSVEAAARAEIAGLPAEARRSTLAESVLELARRLDAGPDDREATGIARELRLSLDALHRRAPTIGEEAEVGSIAALGD